MILFLERGAWIVEIYNQGMPLKTTPWCDCFHPALGITGALAMVILTPKVPWFLYHIPTVGLLDKLHRDIPGHSKKFVPRYIPDSRLCIRIEQYCVKSNLRFIPESIWAKVYDKHGVDRDFHCTHFHILHLHVLHHLPSAHLTSSYFTSAHLASAHLLFKHFTLPHHIIIIVAHLHGLHLHILHLHIVHLHIRAAYTFTFYTCAYYICFLSPSLPPSRSLHNLSLSLSLSLPLSLSRRISRNQTLSRNEDHASQTAVNSNCVKGRSKPIRGTREVECQNNCCKIAILKKVWLWRVGRNLVAGNHSGSACTEWPQLGSISWNLLYIYIYMCIYIYVYICRI